MQFQFGKPHEILSFKYDTDEITSRTQRRGNFYFLFSCFLKSWHRTSKHRPQVNTLNMETENKPYSKFRPLFITSELRSSILKKKKENVPFSTYSISFFSGIPRIFKLALSSGIFSKYDLTYKNRILLFHSENTSKPQPALFFQGCGRHSSFKSDSWFYKAWRSFLLLHHLYTGFNILCDGYVFNNRNLYRKNPFPLNL